MMYKERREKISIKFYVLIALIILIIVFAIILLIPNKKQEPKKEVEMQLYSKDAMDNIKANYSKKFYENMKSFKDVAEKYFIKKQEALLDKQTVTLDKLINDNHMITALTDESGDKCNEEKSQIVYVRNSNNGNYKVTITLVCGKEEESLITYMGNYDYCKDADACEKKIEVTDKKKPKKEEPESPEPVKEPEPTPSEVTTDYPLYEYVLSPSESCGTFSEWSDWSQDKIDATLYKQIETKTETKSVEYECQKQESYITGYREEKYIAAYTITTTKVGTKKDQNGNIVAVYETKKVPVYGTKKVPVYGTRNVGNQNVCKKDESITYYHYRTFEYKEGINYVRYSSSNNDQYLISQGYVATGNTK